MSTQVFTPERGPTDLTLTVLYAWKEARNSAAKSGMTDDMEAAYARLDEVPVSLS